MTTRDSTAFSEWDESEFDYDGKDLPPPNLYDLPPDTKCLAIVREEDIHCNPRYVAPLATKLRLVSEAKEHEERGEKDSFQNGKGKGSPVFTTPCTEYSENANVHHRPAPFKLPMILKVLMVLFVLLSLASIGFSVIVWMKLTRQPATSTSRTITPPEDGASQPPGRAIPLGNSSVVMQFSSNEIWNHLKLLTKLTNATHYGCHSDDIRFGSMCYSIKKKSQAANYQDSKLFMCVGSGVIAEVSIHVAKNYLSDFMDQTTSYWVKSLNGGSTCHALMIVDGKWQFIEHDCNAVMYGLICEYEATIKYR